MASQPCAFPATPQSSTAAGADQAAAVAVTSAAASTTHNRRREAGNVALGCRATGSRGAAGGPGRVPYPAPIHRSTRYRATCSTRLARPNPRIPLHHPRNAGRSASSRRATKAGASAAKAGASQQQALQRLGSRPAAPCSRRHRASSSVSCTPWVSTCSCGCGCGHSSRWPCCRHPCCRPAGSQAA